MKKTIETTMNQYYRSLLLLPVFLMSLLAGAQQAKNPVWYHNWPDPTIWKADDGRYYCIATNPHPLVMSPLYWNWPGVISCSMAMLLSSALLYRVRYIMRLSPIVVTSGAQ